MGLRSPRARTISSSSSSPAKRSQTASVAELYIHINGGVWSERRGDEQRAPSPFSETGSVEWMDAVDLSEGHESGNTGSTTIDLIWVTLK